MTHDDTTAVYPSDMDEVLAEYERAREQGRLPDREAFLAAHPAIADGLRPLLDAADLVGHIVAPVRAALVPLPDGYEPLEVLGQGGMGVVYKARQTGTGQLVALKVLRSDWLAGLDEAGQRKACEGFRREAQAAARLRHPSRVRVFHLGEHQGRPYYAMELIEGESLADKLKGGGIATEKVVRYLAGVAEAVQEAHDREIIHRDIKPQNILIDARTDLALLADFGLARSAREETQVAGTLPYMSPEQIAGRADERSDVYSLGVTLYQALTGVLPFQGQTREELIASIRTDEPVPLRRHKPALSKDLERICLRCLEKDPDRRFQSAREFADALDRLLKDVDYSRNFTKTGARMLAYLPFWVVPHLVVFALMRWPMWEWPLLERVLWPLLFVEPVARCVLMYQTSRDWERPWELRGVLSLWVGLLIGNVFLAFALRVTFPADPATVLLFMYPVGAALTGMAYFTEASKMPWFLRWGPIGFWLIGIVMLFHLAWAPLIFCAYHVSGTIVYARYLIKQGEELG